jgi:hypothetical protein
MATTNWQNAQKTRRHKVDKRGKTTRENISIMIYKYCDTSEKLARCTEKFNLPRANIYLAQ